TPKSEFDLSEDRPGNISLRQLEESWVAKENSPAIFISAKEKKGIDKLRNDLYKMVGETIRGRYPFTGFLWQNFDDLEVV
ncbi:MAG: GTPase HflX, partial [Bacteroidales bacterium]|nr:GTPase HflX [Bacteroidales bacterium]